MSESAVVSAVGVRRGCTSDGRRNCLGEEDRRGSSGDGGGDGGGGEHAALCRDGEGLSVTGVVQQRSRDGNYDGVEHRDVLGEPSVVRAVLCSRHLGGDVFCRVLRASGRISDGHLLWTEGCDVFLEIRSGHDSLVCSSRIVLGVCPVGCDARSAGVCSNAPEASGVVGEGVRDCCQRDEWKVGSSHG